MTSSWPRFDHAEVVQYLGGSDLAPCENDGYSCSRMGTCTHEVKVFERRVPRLGPEAEYVEEGMAQTQYCSFVQVESLLPRRRCIDALLHYQWPQVNARPLVNSLNDGLAGSRDHRFPVLGALGVESVVCLTFQQVATGYKNHNAVLARRSGRAVNS